MQRIVTGSIAMGLLAGAALAAPFGIGFTYQGQLVQNGVPLTGNATVQFQLFNMPAGGAAVSSLEAFNVQVVDGLFTVEDIEFSQGVSVFDGNDVWLQVSVATGGGLPTPLTPRQRIAPTPYALQTRGLFVDSDLNVGVGTTKPISRLHVDGAVAVTGLSQMSFYHQTNPATPSIFVDGDYFGGSQISLREDDGTQRIQLRGDLAQVSLSEPNGQTRVTLESGTTGGGTVSLRNAASTPTLLLDGDADSGGDGAGVYVRNADGDNTVVITGGNGQLGSGSVLVNDPNGVPAVEAYAPFVANGGWLRVYDSSGDGTVLLRGGAASDGGTLQVQRAGGESVVIGAEQPSGPSPAYQIGVYDSSDYPGVGIGDQGQGGFITLYKSDNAFGNARLTLRGSDAAGTGGEILAFNEAGATVLDFDSQTSAAATATATLLMRENDGSNAFQFASTGLFMYDSAGSTSFRLDRTTGEMAIGHSSPFAPLHVMFDDINLQSSALYQDEVVIEDADATLGLYSSAGGNWGSALVLGEVDGGGALVNKWGIARQASGAGNELRFTFGTDANYASNDYVMELDPDGTTRVRVLEILGADVAEKFPSSEQAEPGTVMEIDPANAGKLRISRDRYNRRVAGVVSGAGDIPVGAILGNLPGSEGSPAIALSGRVWVKCDASQRAIEPGDLLTTSDVPGHAMKAEDHEAAQGAVIGKAMTHLAKGETGLVLVLVNLQ